MSPLTRMTDPGSAAEAALPVSVVMVSWRTGPVLDRALDAALDAWDVAELVLVNHGNPPAVEAALDARAARDPRLVLVHTNANLGFAKGCNIGAKAASGEALLFLNPDTLIPPGAAARLAATGAGLASPWVVGARITHPDGTEQRGGRRGALTPASAVLSFTGLSRLPAIARRAPDIHRETEALPEADVDMPVVSGAAMLVDRAGFLALGGFDEGYFLHVEDIDYCRRARLAGGSVRFEPRAGVIHYGGTSRTSPFKVEAHKARGFVRYFWRHWPSPGARALTIAAAPGIWLAIMGRAAALRARDRLTRVRRRMRVRAQRRRRG